MAVPRERPYSQFNFRVKIAGEDGTSTNAGFQEVFGLGTEIHVAEYRPGNYSDNSPMKVNGSYKVPDVTLKRGVVGDLTVIHNWVKAVRDGGNTGPDVLKTVVIALLSEDPSRTEVQTWTLTNARPMKYTGPSLTGKGTDVAVEELVLASEHIEVG
ncbi:MAG: phage tail protein [Acidobacteriia bacterium]|nr:phage tail protein [Terriglobia bacterium]